MMLVFFVARKGMSIMINIEIKELHISIELKRRIEMICRFHNLKCEFISGNIRNIKRTNIAYVEPHQVIINGRIYLLFDDSEFIYADTLDTKIPINEFDNYLKLQK